MASASASSSRAAPAPSGDPKTRLIVGIDFGTTFSGVAWAFTSDKVVRTIRDWPAETQRLEKVKTELAYTKQKRKKGLPYKWGSEVKYNTDKSLRWFKLLLQEGHVDKVWDETNTELASGKLRRLWETLEQMPQGKTAVDLVADYLRALYLHFRKQIREEYGPRVIENLGKEIPVHFYLTVPAIWNTAAKQKTLQAARMAGLEELGSLHLISEPEAAAAHCFVTFQGTHSALKPNDVYVIADCGGGTVDMISYEIISVQPKLQVKEAAVGTGELCGGVFLDDAFEKLIIERIGEDAFNAMSAESKHTMRKFFETKIKRQFSLVPEEEGEEEDDVEVDYFCDLPDVPDNEDAGVHADAISISRDEVKKIFEPSVTKITHMVQEQINTAEKNSKRSVTAVILVGGFGSSKYLRERLKESLVNKNGEKIADVLKVTEAWQAIVQGAVQHGLMCEVHNSTTANDELGREKSGFVQARRVRASYGFSASEPFDPAVHKSTKITFNPLYATFMCPGRMQWFIKKGEELSTKDPKKMAVTRLVPVHAPREAFTSEFEIFMSEADTPPDDQDDESVKVATKFDADYTLVPKERFPVRQHRISDHIFLYQLDTNVIMEANESAEVEFWTECQNKVVGRSEKFKPIYDN